MNEHLNDCATTFSCNKLVNLQSCQLLASSRFHISAYKIGDSIDALSGTIIIYTPRYPDTFLVRLHYHPKRSQLLGRKMVLRVPHKEKNTSLRIEIVRSLIERLNFCQIWKNYFSKYESDLKQQEHRMEAERTQIFAKTTCQYHIPPTPRS